MKLLFGQGENILKVRRFVVEESQGKSFPDDSQVTLSGGVVSSVEYCDILRNIFISIVGLLQSQMPVMDRIRRNYGRQYRCFSSKLDACNVSCFKDCSIVRVANYCCLRFSAGVIVKKEVQQLDPQLKKPPGWKAFDILRYPSLVQLHCSPWLHLLVYTILFALV